MKFGNNKYNLSILIFVSSIVMNINTCWLSSLVVIVIFANSCYVQRLRVKVKRVNLRLG